MDGQLLPGKPREPIYLQPLFVHSDPPASWGDIIVCFLEQDIRPFVFRPGPMEL